MPSESLCLLRTAYVQVIPIRQLAGQLASHEDRPRGEGGPRSRFQEGDRLWGWDRRIAAGVVGCSVGFAGLWRGECCVHAWAG